MRSASLLQRQLSEERERERARSSEHVQLATANEAGWRGLLNREIERVTIRGERASVVVRTGVAF
jgi:hypothetical protein